MLPIFVFLGLVAASIVQDDSDDEVVVSEEDPPQPDEAPTLTVEFQSNTTTQGTDEGEVFVPLASESLGVEIENAVINSGGGNDLIILTDKASGVEEIDDAQVDAGDGADFILGGDIDGGSFAGGDGDDTIIFNEISGRVFNGVGSANILGGAGDDTIDAGLGDGVLIRGGQGDDDISLETPFGQAFTSVVYGDEGNDTIDATGGFDVQVFGGEGDDEIHITNLQGTLGSAPGSTDGGVGDDTIIVDLFDRFPDVDTALTQPTEVTGGDGEDIFLARLDDENFDFSGFQFSGLPEDIPESLGFVISDFEPGEDILVIDQTGLPNGYQATSASLTRVGSEQVNLVVSYEVPEVSETVSIRYELMTQEDVAESDIQFIGGAGSPTFI